MLEQHYMKEPLDRIFWMTKQIFSVPVEVNLFLCINFCGKMYKALSLFKRRRNICCVCQTLHFRITDVATKYLLNTLNMEHSSRILTTFVDTFWTRRT